MGSHACIQLVAAGANDVVTFHVLDDDTGCILRVIGGPANIDNDSIRACAATATTMIGPRQIK